VSRLQEAVRRFDRARGWERVRPEHTLLHLFEELGEVARELLREAGYKEGEGRLTDELADAGLLLYKLADQLGVDLEAAMIRKLAENEARFPLEASRAALDRYLAENDED
jgi:NTP pyrophosphatase (non-canonical NTP hydrolase)